MKYGSEVNRNRVSQDDLAGGISETTGTDFIAKAVGLSNIFSVINMVGLNGQ